MWLQVQYINWLPYSGQTLTSLRSQRPLIFWNWQIKDASSIHIMEVYSQIAHVSLKAKARFRSRNKHIIQKKPQREEFTGTVIIERIGCTFVWMGMGVSCVSILILFWFYFIGHAILYLRAWWMFPQIQLEIRYITLFNLTCYLPQPKSSHHTQIFHNSSPVSILWCLYSIMCGHSDLFKYTPMLMR